MVIRLGKAEWRCIDQEVGEQCVMMAGMEMMLQWYADSWDIPLMASYAPTVSIEIIMQCMLVPIFHLKVL